MTNICSLLALELGRPATINVDDYTIPYPSISDNANSLSNGDWQPALALPQLAAFLGASAQVITTISKLIKTLQNPVLDSSTLRSYDTLFSNCISAFPSGHQIGRLDYLHPSFLAPILYLQNARLLLHRQNLNQKAPQELRTNAIHHCALVARETSHVMARCMQDSLSSTLKAADSWAADLRKATSAFLCTHLWRCTLFLIFVSDFKAALQCAYASAILGSTRAINIACGRYLEFFLQALKAKTGKLPAFELADDEEMMAYVSADLQGSASNAWVWSGSPISSPPTQKPSIPSPKSSPQVPTWVHYSHSDENPPPAWEGWDDILNTLRRLSGGSPDLKVQKSNYASTVSNSGRISIADIM